MMRGFMEKVSFESGVEERWSDAVKVVIIMVMMMNR